MGKKVWLGHAALSCDYNARNWKTPRENYLKLKWIVFPFSKIVTLPVSLLIGPLQQVIHVIQNRHTGKQEKQGGKASYIYVNYYGCCIILFVFMQVCRVWDIVTFFWLNFVTVTCVNKWLWKKDKKGNNYIKLYKPFVYLVPVLRSCTTLMTSCKVSIYY